VCVAYEWHRSRVQWEMQLGDANIICMCVYVCVYVDQYSLHQLYTALHSTALHCTLLQRLLGAACSSHSLHCPSTWRSGRERRVPLQESPNRGTYTYSLTHTLLHILSYTYSILYTLYSILYTLYSLLTPHSSRTINALKTQRRGVRASVRCSTTVGQSRCAAVSKVLRFISLHHIHTASILAPSVLTLTLTLLHVTHTHTQAPRGCAAGGRVGGGAGQYIEL
jgi:hypothetical protein